MLVVLTGSHRSSVHTERKVGSASCSSACAPGKKHHRLSLPLALEGITAMSVCRFPEAVWTRAGGLGPTMGQVAGRMFSQQSLLAEFSIKIWLKSISRGG